MANINKNEAEFSKLFELAQVEREMQKASRNLNGNSKFSPKISRPGNPLGQLFDSEMDEFSLCEKSRVLEQQISSFSTQGSIKD